MTRTMLENLYHDALALMERMRDYVHRDARQDRLCLPWSERVVMLQTNRILTVRLCHALQLIQAHQARLLGDSEILQVPPPRIRLAPVPVDAYRDILPARQLQLADDANHLFERLHAVHIAIIPGDADAFATPAPDGDDDDDGGDFDGDTPLRAYA
ncbi:hypothetical protein [Caenispirillum bisanense]|uniref:hypothetical protein n=1 Tax=Caenispirillum bisanense TaxID=414052 RepID=UPI0031D7DF17